MNDYCFELAGLHTLLRVPGEITVSESLRPFLSQHHKEPDCTIELKPRASLPAFSEKGIWHGLEYYDTFEGGQRIFHCNARNAAPFAVTCLWKNGNIEILVLPDCLSFFSGTTGIFNRIGLETLLLQHDSLLLHASLIKYGSSAIAFAGPSGIGKSTQAELWKHYLGAEIINGDRTVLRRNAQCWMAYGSPYAGTSGIYRNDHAPLKAIILLKKATENRLLSVTAGEALRSLYPELSIHHWDKAFAEKSTDLLLQVLEDIPVYLLECRPEAGAVQLVEKGLAL